MVLLRKRKSNKIFVLTSIYAGRRFAVSTCSLSKGCISCIFFNDFNEALAGFNFLTKKRR